jgi:hypothetical protein
MYEKLKVGTDPGEGGSSPVNAKVSIEDAEAALGAMVSSEGSGGGCGGPWSHELTPVVKHCGVSREGALRVLQVNPTWLRELVARDELTVLADEMRTWFAIESEIAAFASHNPAA